MILSICFLSLFFFVLGWFYYSRPEKIQKLNAFLRDRVFNDRYILVKRKKVAIVCFLLSFLLLTVVYLMSHEAKNRYVAASSVHKDIAFDAAAYYKKAFSEHPDDTNLIIKYAYVYEILGEKHKSDALWNKAIVLNPETKTLRMRLNAKR